ncbi:MAG: C-terminal binding protein [Candidatus Hydrogenedentes bacterium]|nr:C-terminal binding protein [Candidatus Hydrogenedentota bacterium]
MGCAVITDHSFPSIDVQREVFDSAGLPLREVQPICKTEDDIIRTCGDADALLVQWAPVTRKVLEALPRVRCIVRYGVGVNNFELDAAKDLGVCAANVPDFCIEEVSDHGMAMILSLCRRIPQDHLQIARGGWGVNVLRPIHAPSDLTLGLVSFGKIARRVAVKAKVFGFAVVAYDPLVPDAVFAEYGVRKLDLNALLAASDIVSLHCPLIAETTHLINAGTIARMKPGVILVNTSRGPVVDEPALIAALESGAIHSAGLDVFEQEPPAPDNPLRAMPNVILTSHGASVSEKAVETLQRKAAEAARDFLQGKRPVSALW